MAKRIDSGFIRPVFNNEYHLGLVVNGAGLVATGSPAGTLVWPWPFADSTVFRKPLLTPSTSPVHTGILSIGLLLAGGSALISQFMD